MLSYLSVLSAYLKKQLACQKRAGGYDLIFKEILKHEKQDETFFVFVFETFVFICVFFVMLILFIVYHWFGLGGRSLNQNRRVS